MRGHAQGTWAFVDDFCVKRRAELKAAPPFAEIVKQISRCTFSIHYSVEPGRSKGLTHCKRPVLRFNAGGAVFDAFFNSPSSYRAQFLVDPECGQAANGVVLSALREQLEAATEQPTYPHEMESFEARAALRAVSAKIWLSEEEFDFQNPTEDLAVEAWKATAILGVKEARWGLCAPRGPNLEVKGAFLDPYGNEIVTADKIGRRFEVYSCGFS